MTRSLSIRPLLALAVALLLGAASPIAAAEPQPNQLTPQQIAEGWINLFDGETLFGWTPTSHANWKAENGTVAVSEGEEGFLMTTSEFANYELHVEFKAPEATNSGVFLRTPLKPTDPEKDCLELNIAPPTDPFPTASLVARRKWEMPWTSYPSEEELDKPLGVADGWLSLDVRLEGEKVHVQYLGQEEYQYDYVDPTGVRLGRIGLQFREGPIAFRNIRLKPLGLKPMFNGKDLAGWNDDKKEASKFEVITAQGSSGPLPLVGRAGEGGEAGTRSDHLSPHPIKGRGPQERSEGDFELRVTNGRGQLETDAQYGDFVMQFDTRVDGDGLNSGVFFRCIPRDFMNGYECQISNKLVDGDPTKPADFGTGAIFRRVPARRVNARDHEWFTTTLVATGPHMAVWVNGLQVTDWTDERPPHDNPRNGLRTAPGTIALQGHDPTTDIRFRNMRIAELPPKTHHNGTTDTTED